MQGRPLLSLSRPWVMLLLLTGLAVGLMGCDRIAEKELKPGLHTADDVRAVMGKPEMIWEEKDGSQTLEYPRGPEGHQTYMVEIGPDGRYRRMRNILVQDTFAQVKPGMSRDDVRRLLGKPAEQMQLQLKQETVWSWRHMADAQRSMMFNVHFGDDWRVRSVSSSPDPKTINGG